MTIIIPVLLLGVFFLLVTKNNVYLETYDIERFDRAKQTIRSPITIENEQETERKIRETVQAVEDRYTISEEITKERLQYIEEIFEATATLENVETAPKSQDKSSEDESKEKDKPKKREQNALTDLDKLDQLKQILSEEIVESIDDTYLLQLIRMNEKDREQGQAIVEELVNEVLAEGVRTENIQSAAATVNQEIKYSDYPEG